MGRQVLLSPASVLPHRGPPWVASAEEETKDQVQRPEASCRLSWIWPPPAWELGWEEAGVSNLWAPQQTSPQGSQVPAVMSGGAGCSWNSRCISGGSGR